MNENREPAFWPWVCTFGGCCAVVGYFIAQGDHVTAVALTVIVLSALFGYYAMASRILSLFCGLVVAALLAPTLGLFCEPRFAYWFGTSGSTNRVLTVAVVGLVIVLGVAGLIKRFVMRYCRERPSLDTINRLAGFGLGAGQGAILCLIVAGGLLAFEPIAKSRLASGAQVRDNLISCEIAGQVAECAEQTRGSALGRLVADGPLFRNLLPLKGLRDDSLGLSDRWTKTPSQLELAIDEHRAAR